MRISDWSSDVCSSDLSAARAADCAADQTNRDDGCSPAAAATPVECPQVPAPALRRYASARLRNEDRPRHRAPKTWRPRDGSVLRPAPTAGCARPGTDCKTTACVNRKSVAEGKEVIVRVDVGGSS